MGATNSEEESYSDSDKESDYFGSFLIPREQLEKIKTSSTLLFPCTS